MWFTIVLLVNTISDISAGTTHLYISPKGSDSNSGLDTAHPLKTIHKARDKLEETGIKNNEVYIELMQGYHDLPTTLKFSHHHQYPVTVRSYQHQEVHVTGGKRISCNQFKHLDGKIDSDAMSLISSKSHSKVRRVNLKDVGITDFGKLTKYGFYSRRTAPLEIFINGKPLRLAEWPNNNFINIKSIPNGRHATTFTHSSTRDVLWSREKDPWVYGFWYWSWADQSAQVKRVDPHAHEITLTDETHYGLRTGNLRSDGRHYLNGYSHQGGYFRVFNMLSELDQPGEYYLDRTTGILYMWPNTPNGDLKDTDIVYVSLINTCITLADGMKNMNFEDFTLEACRHYGIEASSGHNLKFINLEVKNTGSYGISCSGDCRSVSISKCELHDSDGGIKISGGIRKSLTSSGNIVEDNHIHHFGRASAVGSNGISVSGVNNIIKNNHMHHCTYTGIYWTGNDHVFEYNHIHDCCFNSTDCGAFMTGRDWTFRGNVIRYNYLHDNVRHWPGAEVRAVMLDDQMSSITMEKNIFAHNEVHANIGGGRDNIFRYNVFYESKNHALEVDGRGHTGTGGNSASLETKLKAMPYIDSVWASKYPKLAAMAKMDAKTRGAPGGNQILHNLYVMLHGKKTINYHGSYIMNTNYFNHIDNHAASKSDFVSPEHNNFKLRCQARDWANKANFPEPVSYDKVGPRFPYGPRYLNKGISPVNKVYNSITTGNCQ